MRISSSHEYFRDDEIQKLFIDIIDRIVLLTRLGEQQSACKRVEPTELHDLNLSQNTDDEEDIKTIPGVLGQG